MRNDGSTHQSNIVPCSERLVRIGPSWRGGYIIVYAMLTVSIMLLITTTVSRSALSEVFTSRDVMESAKAIVAAESAVECVLAHDLAYTDYYPLDTTSPVSTMTCHFIKSDLTLGSATLQVGNLENRDTTIDWNCYEYDYTPTPLLLGSNDGVCAKLDIKVLEAYVSGYNTKMCDVKVRATGYNNCANPSVQRVRWTDLVPDSII